MQRLFVDFTSDYAAALEQLLRGLGVPPRPKSIGQSPEKIYRDASGRVHYEFRVPVVVLTPVYLDAMEAYHLEQWQVAAEKFREIVAVQADYEDAATKLAELERRFQSEANRQLQLPALYKQMLKAVDAKQWQAARATLEQIWSVDQNYRETRQWMERVTAELWKLVPRTIVGKDGKEMILVPPGEFVMGQDGINDAPPHKVYLDAYYIARYPVTNAEYKKFVDATRCAPPQHWSSGQIPPGKENHPVVWVTWEDANAYARWAGVRLPTEAEWEKAASWDDAKKVKRGYPWGDKFDANKCNSSESRIGDTTPVGKYSPHGDSPYGVADMAGNVWAWCADWYEENYYNHSPAQNPKGPESGDSHVLRGGSFYYDATRVLPAFRDWGDPNGRTNHSGFRLVVGAS